MGQLRVKCSYYACMWNHASIMGQQSENGCIDGRRSIVVIQCPRNHRWYISGWIGGLIWIRYLAKYGVECWNIDACMWKSVVDRDNMWMLLPKWEFFYKWYSSMENQLWLCFGWNLARSISNRYDNYRWSVSHILRMWNPWWIYGDSMWHAVLMVEFDYVIQNAQGTHYVMSFLSGIEGLFG